MKYGDGFFQDLRRISPNQPRRSARVIDELINRYELEPAKINNDFLMGFQYAVTIIGEALKEERTTDKR